MNCPVCNFKMIKQRQKGGNTYICESCGEVLSGAVRGTYLRKEPQDEVEAEQSTNQSADAI